MSDSLPTVDEISLTPEVEPSVGSDPGTVDPLNEAPLSYREMIVLSLRCGLKNSHNPGGDVYAAGDCQNIQMLNWAHSPHRE